MCVCFYSKSSLDFYTLSLQAILSTKLAAVNPRLDFNIDEFIELFAKEVKAMQMAEL